MNQAYATRDTKRARRLLEGLARQLEHQHPGAAASLREGLEETLTVMRLGLPENLERVRSSTNLMENLFSRGACDRPPGQTLAARHHGAALDRGRRARSRTRLFANWSAIAPCRAWSRRCALTMCSSIVPSVGLTTRTRLLK